MSVPLIDVERAEFSNRRWLVCHSERQAVKLVPNFDRLEEAPVENTPVRMQDQM